MPSGSLPTENCQALLANLLGLDPKNLQLQSTINGAPPENTGSGLLVACSRDHGPDFGYSKRIRYRKIQSFGGSDMYQAGLFGKFPVKVQWADETMPGFNAEKRCACRL